MGPSPIDYSRWNQTDQLYAEDMADRTMDGLRAMAPAAMLGVNIGAAVLGARAVGRSMTRGRLSFMMGKTGQGALTRAGLWTARTAGKYAAGGVIGTLAVEATLGAARFAGVGEAFGQFEEMERFREISSLFMAGTAGNVVTGRASEA